MLLLAMGVTACSNQHAQTSHKVHARVTAKVKSAKKKKAELKKRALKKKAQEKAQKNKQATQKAASQSQNQSQSQQAQSNQNQPQANSKESYEEYIGRLNRQRGYDPKGNPIMPGQDHAPGALPDGNPDPWVQAQIDDAIKEGYLNPDGSPTEKEKQAEREADQYSDSNDYDDYNY